MPMTRRRAAKVIDLRQDSGGQDRREAAEVDPEGRRAHEGAAAEGVGRRGASDFRAYAPSHNFSA
jgi:hypothetical protein